MWLQNIESSPDKSTDECKWCRFSLPFSHSASFSSSFPLPSFLWAFLYINFKITMLAQTRPFLNRKIVLFTCFIFFNLNPESKYLLIAVPMFICVSVLWIFIKNIISDQAVLKLHRGHNLHKVSLVITLWFNEWCYGNKCIINGLSHG